jgi:hypothetical protein
VEDRATEGRTEKWKGKTLCGSYIAENEAEGIDREKDC